MKLTCLAESPSNEQQGAIPKIYAGMSDGSVACWSLGGASSHEVIAWTAHGSPGLGLGTPVTNLGFATYAGKHTDAPKLWLVSCSEDRTIRIWDPQVAERPEDFEQLKESKRNPPRLLKELYGHTGGVLMLCYASRQQLLWSGSRDHSIRSWCLEEAALQLREIDAMEQADHESRTAAIVYSKMKNVKKDAKKKPGKAGANPASPTGAPAKAKSPGAKTKSPRKDGSPKRKKKAT